VTSTGRYKREREREREREGERERETERGRGRGREGDRENWSLAFYAGSWLRKEDESNVS
jgi:hypothetical protein